MASVFVKTEAGQREIRERAHVLPRAARTMLVLVDGTKTQDQLTAMVQGSTAEDLAALLKLELIVETAAASAPASSRSGVAAAARAPEAPPAGEPVEPAQALGYTEMYSSLTELVRGQMGLVKAFKYTLEIEKASTVPDLMDIARRFAVDVETLKGDVAAKMVRRALGLND